MSFFLYTIGFIGIYLSMTILPEKGIKQHSYMNLIGVVFSVAIIFLGCFFAFD